MPLITPWPYGCLYSHVWILVAPFCTFLVHKPFWGGVTGCGQHAARDRALFKYFHLSQFH